MTAGASQDGQGCWRLRLVDEVDLIIARVPSAEDPYDLGLRIMSAAVDLLNSSVVASGVYRLWAELTDWAELVPGERSQAVAAMRSAAAEWDAVKDDDGARDEYFQRWSQAVPQRP
jgi:hypothetical protein